MEIVFQDDDPPPKPLILGGWVGSCDVEKGLRWQETVEWASARGLSHLIPDLTDDEKYFGGRRFWEPVLGEQFEKPKRKPAPDETTRHLIHLQENWPL